MAFVDLLFEPAVLLFTVPVLVALVFWLLAVVGLFDLRLFDGDADVHGDVHADVQGDLHGDVHGDVHADGHGGADGDVDGGGVLHLLGVGMIPLSLVVTLLFFFFGWTGIALHALAGDLLSALGWGGLAKDLVFAPVAFVAGGACSAGVARLLRPLFRDYGEAPAAYTLVGQLGVVRSSTVSTLFGEVTVRTPGGPVEIAARTDLDPSDLRYGDQVLVLDYDPASNTYLVERLAPDDEALPGTATATRPPRRLTT